MIINGSIVVEVENELSSGEEVSDGVEVGGESTLEERHWQRSSAIARIVLIGRVVVVGAVNEATILIATNDDDPSVVEGL